MIKAIAIDDEPQALEIIKHHASKIEEINLIETFYNPIEAIKFLSSNHVDFIFLDIKMPEITGIEFIQLLKYKPLIVFTTAFNQFAVESYQLEAVDYLLKPIDFEDFHNSISKIKKALSKKEQNQSHQDYVFIKDGTKTIKLFYNEILFLKGSGNYVEFITKSKKYLSRITITELIKKLPSKFFERVHNSYIINIEHIEKIEHNHIKINDEKISIGENYKKSFYSRIKDKMI